MAANLRERLGPAVQMGGGLVVVGLAGYLFLALAGYSLDPAHLAAVSSFYLIVSIVGPGVFAGLEQETTRSASAWLMRGGEFRVFAKRAALVGLGLLLAMLIAVAAFSPLLGERVFDGDYGLVVAILVGIAGSAATYLVRGLLAGMQRFSGYAASLAVEGLSRIVLCGVVALIGVTSSVVYALVFSFGLVLAVFAGLPWLRKPAAGDQPLEADVVAGTPHDTTATMARGAVLLVGATFGFQAVANVAPVLVTGRLEDKLLAGAFASAFVLVRIPVLLFAAVQAMLLPALTRAAAEGDRAGITKTLRLFALALLVIGVPTLALAYFFGGWAVQVFFSAKVELPGALVMLLAASSLLLMACQVLLPALVALGKHRVVTAAWTVGGVILVVAVLLPFDPVWTATWAQLGTCALVVAIMITMLAAALRRLDGPRPQVVVPAA